MEWRTLKLTDLKPSESRLEKDVVPEEKNAAETIQPIFRRILVPIDKAGYKGKIIEYGVKLAKALRSEIFALHIINESLMSQATDTNGAREAKGKDYEEDYRDALRKQAQKILDEARLVGQNEGVKINIEIVSTPSVADAIIDYAKSKNIDLILIGTKGIAGLEKFLLGSVASIVISRAHCPVLAVR